MVYFIFLVLFLSVIIFLFITSSSKKKIKKIAALQKAWGQNKNEYFNFNLISKYFDINEDICFHNLSEQTKNDIDFNELFSFVDRTTSKCGQQFLYDKLSKPSNNVHELKEMNERVKRFSENITVREKTQLLLLELSSDNGYYLPNLMSDHLIKKPKWYGLIVLDIIITLVLIFITPFYPGASIWLILPLAINLGVHFWNKNNTYQFIKSFPQLNILINVCKKILKLDSEKKPEIEKSIDQLKSFQRKRRMLNIGISISGSEMEQVLYFLIEIVKAFFLIEFFTFYSLIKELENKQSYIRRLFKFIGNIDSDLSIASLRATKLQTCEPVITDEAKKINLKQVYHPLVEDCVANDLYVDGKSILITGSNMSGKTTFLRSAGINNILAQTIYTCFADEFQCGISKLFSSIRIDDSVTEGKSYYFEEVNIMNGLVSTSTSGISNIFLLDEVFKGTNTIERISSAKAILSYLNKGENIVFVSTHDVELVDMLKEEYDLYHFEESIIDGKLHFDYHIKNGELKTRNAIKILELSGYPMEIIEEASRISGKLSIH